MTSRERAIAAMSEAVAESGYASLSVERVIDRAQMSRRTFYEEFPNLEACFLASYDAALDEVLGEVACGGAAQARAEPLDAALVRVLRYLSRRPRSAYLLLVAPSSVPVTLERQERSLQSLARALARATTGSGATLRHEAAVGAIHGVLRARVAGGRTRQLQRLAPELAAIARRVVSEAR